MAEPVSSPTELPEQCVSDLVRVGLASRGENGVDGDPLHFDPDLDLFLPLLSQFNVRLVPMTVSQCPVKFCTGTINLPAAQGRSEGSAVTTIPAGGQADTSSYAALSCLGEISERLSLCSLGVQDSRVEVGLNLQSGIALTEVLGFSKGQWNSIARRFDSHSGSSGAKDHGLRLFSGRVVDIRRLGGGMCSFYPSAGVLFGEVEQVTGRSGGFASTVGCAVWRDREGARRRALLELVERDAVAQAWYNRLGITRIAREQVAALLPQPLVDYLEENKRFWGLYSVATDLKVHIAMSVSCEADGRRTAFGSAAGWDLGSAAKSAVTEMLQSENALQLMETAYAGDSGIPGEARKQPRHLIYAKEKSVFSDFLSAAVGEGATPDAETVFTYADLLDSCADKGVDIWEFDATRSDLGIPCIKLISQALCSWEPRFGKDRLYRGVVDRGLRKEPATEAEFERRPFPF